MCLTAIPSFILVSIDCEVVATKNVHRYCQVSPGGQNHPPLRIAVLDYRRAILGPEMLSASLHHLSFLVVKWILEQNQSQLGRERRREDIRREPAESQCCRVRNCWNLKFHVIPQDTLEVSFYSVLRKGKGNV